MPLLSARLSLAFSCIGHLFAHLFEPIFYLTALVLPGELGLPYEEVLALIIAAKVLYGLLAPLMGWLGDRWSTTGMMVIFFLGLGVSAMGVGLAWGPWSLAILLGLTGFFGSIYHPVGISWLIRNAESRGKAIGLNGVFGGIGPAVASLVAGAAISLWGWRAAFVLPGALLLVVGMVFTVLVWRGVICDSHHDRAPEPAPSRHDAIRVGIILSVTMLCAGLIYQASQPALPKLFEDRLGDGAGLGGVAMAVTLVYLLAGVSQIVAGHLADRLSPRMLYQGMALVQIPFLLLLSQLQGVPMVLVALLAVTANMASIPAENMLLSRYTPARWRGTAFGLKFVLSFGVSGLAVPLVSLIRAQTGDFTALFLILAASATVVSLCCQALPRSSALKHLNGSER